MLQRQSFLYQFELHNVTCFIFPNCREVEDFARRLNSVWPERMQDILSLGQERRLVPFSMNGNGSLKRYTGKLFSRE